MPDITSIETKLVMRMMNLGNRGFLFEQQKAQNDPKKFHGELLCLRECVVHSMKFFRVVSVFRCKKNTTATQHHRRITTIGCKVQNCPQPGKKHAGLLFFA